MMFTIEQIEAAHSKVKSGAEYPKYVAEIKKLGVASYTYFVADGHTEFQGQAGYRISSPASSAPREIAEEPDVPQFQARLVANQKGETTFPEFCDDCARTGVSRWVADFTAMTCSYYSLNGELAYIEAIPGAGATPSSGPGSGTGED